MIVRFFEQNITFLQRSPCVLPACSMVWCIQIGGAPIVWCASVMPSIYSKSYFDVSPLSM